MIHRKAPGKFVYGNIQNASDLWQFTEFLSNMDGGSLEFFSRWNTAASVQWTDTPALDYSWFMQRLSMANDLGKPLICWDGWADAVTNPQAAYARASFLLRWAGNGMSALGVWQDVSGGGDPATQYWTWDIGTPTGAMFNADAVSTAFQREFTGGRVILNAHGTTAKSFTLGTTFRRMDGTTTSSPISLAAHTAEVLRFP
jgi:hypothetical protein